MKEELDPNKKTILVVDDEKPIIDILVYNLKKEGYNTLEATDGEMGINVALEARPDLILLDVMLPKVDGLTVCNRVKQVYNVPILMISARDEEVDKIVGLELGADDYITKPFSLSVLMLKIEAYFNRINNINTESEFVSKDIRVLPREMKVFVKDEETYLTKNEWKMLSLFMQHPKQVLSKNQILENLFDIDGEYVDENTVAVNIRRLREKIEECPGEPRFVHTKWGVGYYFMNME